MKIKTLIPYTAKDGDTLISPRKGEVLDVSDEVGESLIADGYAEAYTLITPEGKITITENGTDIDVAQYAKADVAVPNPNRVVTVTGTMADPWGDLDPAELLAGLNDNSITMWLSATMGGTTTLPLCPRKCDTDALGFYFVTIDSGSIMDGMEVLYMGPEWNLMQLYVLTGGAVTDYSAYAESATTELTVIYHPLPEA